MSERGVACAEAAGLRRRARGAAHQVALVAIFAASSPVPVAASSPVPVAAADLGDGCAGNPTRANAHTSSPPLITLTAIATARAAEAPPRWVEAVAYGGVTVAAAREGGLYRLESTGPVRIEIGLTERQEQIRGLAVLRGELWLGTEAGLLRLARTSCGYAIETVIRSPVSLLTQRQGSLEVISLAGRYQIDARRRVRRVDSILELATAGP